MKIMQTQKNTFKILLACLLLSGTSGGLAQNARAPRRKPDGEELFDKIRWVAGSHSEDDTMDFYMQIPSFVGVSLCGPKMSHRKPWLVPILVVALGSSLAGPPANEFASFASESRIVKRVGQSAHPLK